MKLTWKDLGEVEGYTATAFSDDTIGIEDDAGYGITVNITTLVFFIQEYQKHFPIKAKFSEEWKGMYGSIPDRFKTDGTKWEIEGKFEEEDNEDVERLS